MSYAPEDRVPERPNVTPKLIGAAVAFLGGTVLVSWYLHTLELVTIPTNWVPMEQSTAMGFLFTGLAVVAHCIGRRRAALTCGAIGAGIGSMALAEMLLGHDVALVDYLFASGEGDAAPSMSPATALCFSLAGCLILVHSLPRTTRRWRGFSVGVLAALLSATGFAGLLNFVLDHGAAGSWTQFTKMEVHAALAFIGLGAAFFGMLGHFQSLWLHRGLPRWASWGAGLTVGILILGVWVGLTSTEERIHSMTIEKSRQAALSHAGHALEAHVRGLRQMTRLFAHRRTDPQADLDEIIGSFREEVPSLRGVAWLRPDGALLYEGGPAAASPEWARSLLENGEVQEAVERSRDQEVVTSTDPFWGGGEDSRLVVCMPGERGRETVGFLLFEHETRPFFQSVFTDSARTLDVELLTLDDEPFFRTHDASASTHAHLAARRGTAESTDHIVFGDRIWKVCGIQDPIWTAGGRSVSNTLILWVGIFLAVSVALLVRKSEQLRERASSLETATRTIEENAESMRDARDSLEEQTLYLSATEEQLRSAALEKRRVLDSLSAFLIGCDRDGIVTEWNAVSSELFGLQSERTLGQRLELLEIPWNRKQMRRAIAECLENGERVARDDIVLTTLDEEGEEQSRVLSLTISPTAEGTGYSIIGADVTSQRMLEMQLSHSQRLESVGTLAAGIAHEINTPMQFVNDNVRFLSQSAKPITELLQRVPALLEAAREAGVDGEQIAEIERIVGEMDIEFVSEEMPLAISETLDGIDRVTTIVRAMKEFSHPGKDGVAAADINKALETTLQVARNEYKYHATVEIDYGDLPPVDCWIADLNQVFLNLLVNGAHAIRDKLGDSGDMGTITIATRQAGAEVEIRVSDTGCGIPEDIRDKIFDQFYTTKEVGRGTGQGLAIARSVVVDKHGGSIHIESELGMGTTFIVRIPVKQELSDVGEEEAHPVC